MGSSLTIVLTAIIAGIGYVLKIEIEKRREIEKQLSEKKYGVYISIIELFFSMFETIWKNKEQGNVSEETIDKLFKIVEGLVIYGSDNVVKKFAYWKTQAAGSNGSDALVLFIDVIIEIRKDMGNQNTKMNMDDLLGMLIIDYESYKKKLIEDMQASHPHVASSSR